MTTVRRSAIASTRPTRPPTWLLCLGAFPAAVATLGGIDDVRCLFEWGPRSATPITWCFLYFTWGYRALLFSTTFMVLLPCLWARTRDSRPLWGLGAMVSGLTIAAMLSCAHSLFTLAGFLHYHPWITDYGAALLIGAAVWTSAGAVQFCCTRHTAPVWQFRMSLWLLCLQAAGCTIAFLHLNTAARIAAAAMAAAQR